MDEKEKVNSPVENETYSDEKTNKKSTSAEYEEKSNQTDDKRNSSALVTTKDIKKSIFNSVRRVVAAISLMVFVFAAAWLINDLLIEPYQQNKLIKDTTVDEGNTATTVDENTGEVILDKYSALLSKNEDFVGKLIIPAIDDGGLNVVQTDNNYTYLTTSFDKKSNTKYGTLFVDYRNNIKNFNSNTIIYGHNMRDGTQLGNLNVYEDIETYKAFPTLKFNTIYKDYEWKIFAAFITNGDAEQDNGYAFPYIETNIYPSDDKFYEFIDEVKSRSFFINEDVDIIPGDKILTISTCNTSFDDARFVVMARLVREGESAEVDTSKAVVNTNQRFPQAWYTAQGKSNPFKNASKFTFD